MNASPKPIIISDGSDAIIRLPKYKPRFPTYGNDNINGNCPAFYSKTWSDVLIVIVRYFFHDILKTIDQEIPKVIFEAISVFYSNDITHHRSYSDYTNALLVCKFFSYLKESKRAQLNEIDASIKKKYALTKKSGWSTKKILLALKDYNKGDFQVNGGAKIEDFQVIFVDHVQNKYNLQRFSYPNDSSYTISADELKIITAIRDSQDLNWMHPVIYLGQKQSDYHRSNELKDLLHKQYFRTAADLSKTYTIVGYRENALNAIDYDNIYSYFLFVFKFFTVIIHDKTAGDRHTTRTFNAKAMINRFSGILEHLNKSGL